MFQFGPIFEHATPYMLVLIRISGIFLAAPAISGFMIPIRIKALLVVMFTAAIYPAVSITSDVPQGVDLITIAPVIATELLIGLTIGLLAMLPLMGVQLAGMLAGYQMGLAMARAFDPNSGTDSVVVGQLLYYLAFGAFLTMGGLDHLFLAVVNTFERVPIGGFWFDQAPLETFVGTLTAAFVLGIRIAAPIVAIIMLIMVSMGFIMKTMPQINVLTIGFAIKIIVGLMVMAMSITMIERAAGEEVERVLILILDWTASLGPSL
ncbi:flagellar biosynthetic protein FliR [Roseiflexus sp. AH-315-K22]|nr:flagellar biosynthetic protein FliR [Roseiflexus sp. AH-315-K22]